MGAMGAMGAKVFRLVPFAGFGAPAFHTLAE